MKSTYSVEFSQEELEEIQAIISLIGEEDVPYEDALAAYDEIIMRGSLDWGLFVCVTIMLLTS